MDKLKAIASFVRIVDRGSLTAAAQDLGVSLPSVVRGLAALERELGVTLLQRSTRRLHLTDAGQEYLERCRAAIALLDEGEALLQARRVDPSGRLAVTASMLFGTRFVAPLLTELVQRHAALQVELLLVDRLVNLIDEGMDVAVRIGALPDSSLVAVPLGAVRQVVCASPAYLQAHGDLQRPEDLGTHHCVRFTGIAPQPEWAFRAPPGKVEITSVISCNQPEVAIEACAQGLGPGQFLSYMVAPLVRAGRLRYVLEAFEREPLPVHLVWPQARRVSPALRAFVDLCVERLRATPLD
ncbi:MAG: LysR family transcriptional regulator [Rubrivivax sp.]